MREPLSGPSQGPRPAKKCDEDGKTEEGSDNPGQGWTQQSLYLLHHQPDQVSPRPVHWPPGPGAPDQGSVSSISPQFEAFCQWTGPDCQWDLAQPIRPQSRARCIFALFYNKLFRHLNISLMLLLKLIFFHKLQKVIQYQEILTRNLQVTPAHLKVLNVL